MTLSPYLSLGGIYGCQKSPNTMLISCGARAKRIWSSNLSEYSVATLCLKMALNLTRLLALFSVFCVLATTARTLTIEDVKKLAKAVETNLTSFFDEATQYNKLQEEYKQQSAQLSLTKKDGAAIANTMKKDLEAVLKEKIDSIKNLAVKTAELRKNYTYDPSLRKTEYFNSKNLQGLNLGIDPKFSAKIEINKSSSVVHIPTDVYSGGVGIVNTIKWTSGLDKYFKENEQDDPSLLWQYFGSIDGVYRVYPGFAWSEPEKDIFDLRRRGWYIQGSSSPKDIVLILDLSGSMAGQKLSILKLAALSLLETLQENDYVNIVAVYEGEPVMVCQLKSDGTTTKDNEMGKDCRMKLLQATAQNKKFLHHFVPYAQAKGIAKASKGFELAIKVLKESRGKNSSSECTQAVILFTDGIENSQSKESRKILKLENADKKIRVFTYLVGSEKGATGHKELKEISINYRGCLFKIQTISDVREKVLSYVSVLSRPLGSAPGGPDPSWTPIYLDRLGLGLMITLVAPVFNTTGNSELLGVVGTDVALPELEGTVPGSEVGVNGYGFAINNNGFVLFHPDLDKKKDPPNIALNELEYNNSEAEELMHNMIDRLSGSMTFKNRLLSDDKRRLSFREKFHYFYSPVINTSFSAAVAIPELGLYSLQATVSDLNNVECLRSSNNNEDVVVAPWKICSDTPVAAESTTPVYEPAYANSTDIINDEDRVKNCNDTKLKNLLFDANVTKMVAEKWHNANKNKEKKIHSVFVGTHGGIMRILNAGSESPFTKRDYIKEEFYTQAAQYANKGAVEQNIIVFTTPYRSENYQPGVNETTLITASSAVLYQNNQKNQVVAAVAGIQFDQEKLQGVIAQKECNNTEEYFCRLIDDDGFILATNQNDDEIGKFFGVLEGAVLKKFINESLFEELTFNNVQAECKKPELDTSNARTLLNPLFAVTSYVQFWTQTVFWSLMQFNIYSFFSRGHVALAEEEEKKIPCTQQMKFFKGAWESRTTEKPEPLDCPDDRCDWRVYMAAVERTNLRLVVVRRCRCEENESIKLTTKPEDMVNITPIPKDLSYRKPPELKSSCNDLQEKGKPPCALASLVSPQSMTVVFLLILALLIPCNENWR